MNSCSSTHLVKGLYEKCIYSAQSVMTIYMSAQ